MKRLLFSLTFACALSALAQTNHVVPGTGGDPVRPLSGTDSGLKISPDGEVSIKNCVFVNTGNVSTPVDGVTIHIQTGSVAGSGGHDHEVLSQYQIFQGPRPGLVALHAYAGDWTIDPNGNVQTVTTDAFGCVTTPYRLPGFAGWFSYTVTTDPFQFGTCGPLGNPEGCYVLVATSKTTTFEARSPANGPALVIYAFTQVNPAPWDKFELNDPAHDVTSEHMWLDPGVADQVYSASLGYSQMFTFPADYAIAWRGSLEFGGIADNFSGNGGTVAPDGFIYPDLELNAWASTYWEEHFYGYEIDMLNPYFANSSPMLTGVPPNYLRRYFLGLVKQMNADNCFLGENQPGVNPRGSLLSDPATAQAWWINNNNLHFVCKSSPLPLSVVY